MPPEKQKLFQKTMDQPNPKAPKKYPEPAVGALILHPTEPKVLLLKSKRWKNQFRIPRGHVNQGESVTEALTRIAKAETGMNVKPIEMIALQESIFSKEFTQPRHFIFLDFLCKAKAISAGDSAKLNANFAWVQPHKALDLTMNDSTRATMDAYLQKIRG